MSAVFADTSFYQALLNGKDARHDDAVTVFNTLEVPIITTEYNFLELGALMSKGVARKMFVQFLDRVRQDPHTCSLKPASVYSNTAMTKNGR